MMYFSGVINGPHIGVPLIGGMNVPHIFGFRLDVTFLLIQDPGYEGRDLEQW